MMKVKAMVLELEKNILQFSPFFHEWIKDKRCNLNEEDLYLIEIHSRNGFKISLYESFMFFNNNKNIAHVNSKLKIEYRKYKEWLISSFLSNIISIARKNNGWNVLISSLEINNQIKTILEKFNVRTLNEIYIKFKEEDFLKERNFKLIIEFERALKLNKN
ncbi:MAG: hypothetical protein JNJ40_15365 [Bacteroidia bacterium]|nr:hypothetical protein [Bacteroidia bacterium]